MERDPREEKPTEVFFTLGLRVTAQGEIVALGPGPRARGWYTASEYLIAAFRGDAHIVSAIFQQFFLGL
jgi:hypothetical protein